MKKIFLIFIFIISTHLLASDFNYDINLKDFPINSNIIGTIDIKEFSKTKEFSKIFYRLQKELIKNRINVNLNNLTTAYFFSYFDFDSAIIFKEFKIPDISGKKIKINKHNFFFRKKMYKFLSIFKDMRGWKGYFVYKNGSIIGSYHLIKEFIKVKYYKAYSIISTPRGLKLKSILSKVDGSDIKLAVILNDHKKTVLRKRYKKKLGNILWDLLVDNFVGFSLGGRISNNKMNFLLLLVPTSEKELKKLLPVVKNILKNLKLLNRLFRILNIKNKVMIKSIMTSLKVINHKDFVILSFSIKNKEIASFLSDSLQL